MTSADFAVIFSMAIAIAISPAAIIELILVLFSKRRVVNSIAFVISIAVLMSFGLFLGAWGSAASGSEAGEPSLISNIVMGILGAFLLVMGISNWIKRADKTEPKVFQAIGNMGPAAVAFLGFGATIINPKNLPLLLSGGEIIEQTSSPFLAGAVFLLVGTSPFVAAMLFSLFGGETAKKVLDKFRVWLISNNRIIMAVICGLLGAFILIKSVLAFV